MSESRTLQNKALTEMARGYSRSRVLGAAARLGVADALGDDERSIDQLAVMCGAQPEPLYRLLRALASLGIVIEITARRFVLTPFGKPLRRDSPNSEWTSVVFWADLLGESWAHLTECIRTGDSTTRIMARQGIASPWSRNPDARDIFRAVMGTAPAEDYIPIARAWNFSKFRTVADIGGGGGALIAAVLKEFPNMQGVLVDFQESIDRAIARFKREGLFERCRFLAADLCQAVPSGAEVYIMRHVLHAYEDGPAVKILRHCRSVLPAEGRLLVIELVLPDIVDHADPELERHLMSDLNMLAVTGGKERGAAEWRNLLISAGLECQHIIRVPGELDSIIEAAPGM